MIERQESAEHVNTIINDPSVYPWVCGSVQGELDASALVADPHNVALFGKFGGVIFVQINSGLYEAHTQVLPEGRGRWTIDMVNECLDWMFCRTDAFEVCAKVPQGNIGAKALVHRVGLQQEFRIERGWTYGGKLIPADVYAITAQRWSSTAPHLPKVGRWFHDELEKQYRLIGKDIDQHDDDEVHDRYVGAAVRMMFGGQTDKAIIFYNRWAMLSGYQPLQIISKTPLMIDIRDSFLLIRNNSFQVI